MNERWWERMLFGRDDSEARTSERWWRRFSRNLFIAAMMIPLLGALSSTAVRAGSLSVLLAAGFALWSRWRAVR